MPGTLGLIPPAIPEPRADLPADPVTAANLKSMKQFAAEVLNQNGGNIHLVVQGTKRSFLTVYGMYIALFVVGLGAAVAAIVRSFTTTSMGGAVMVLGCAGLTAATFFTIFLLKPLDSMGRQGIFLTWLVGVTNTYWTRLLYLRDPATMEADLRSATADLVQELSALADKYAAASKQPARVETTDTSEAAPQPEVAPAAGAASTPAPAPAAAPSQ